jgi:hypothetical protein
MLTNRLCRTLVFSCTVDCLACSAHDRCLFVHCHTVQHEISEASKRSKQNYKSSSWLSLLDTEAATWVDILVCEEVNRALHRSDLDKLLELIDVLPADLRACDQLGLSNDRVATVLRAFYASLFSTVTAQFDRLQDPALRERMRNGIADELAAAHAKVSSATMFSELLCADLAA